MKNLFLCAAIAAALPIAGLAKTLTIGIDYSGSNPLLTHKHFAASAAAHVEREIQLLEIGDSVRVLGFGARNIPDNMREHAVTISRRARAPKVAASVRKFVETLPERTDISQGSTNLIAWLEFTGGYACHDGGQILVLTDAVEASEFARGAGLLDGTSGLPDPIVDLTGCTLTFYGLGAGFSGPSVLNLRAAWQSWAEKSGAVFNAVIR